ncbi:DUF167 domain-containing protein [Candidatus Nomurabacteria bacterium]|nr:DUF167 domain-containing protein [Candidatus Nomurabacteria bacterium]
MKLAIKVIPRAKENKIEGTLESGSLRVRLTAAPTDGQANEQLIKLVSKHFKIAKSCIRIVRGHTGRDKVIEISQE